jgi:hypothetical protein
VTLLLNRVSFIVAEHFRRPPLIKSTGAMADLVATANSPGLIAYQEAGCRKADEDCSLVGRLNATLNELQGHVQKSEAQASSVVLLEHRICLFLTSRQWLSR